MRRGVEGLLQQLQRAGRHATHQAWVEHAQRHGMRPTKTKAKGRAARGQQLTCNRHALQHGAQQVCIVHEATLLQPAIRHRSQRFHGLEAGTLGHRLCDGRLLPPCRTQVVQLPAVGALRTISGGQRR